MKLDLGGKKLQMNMKTVNGGQSFHGDKSLTLKGRREMGLGIEGYVGWGHSWVFTGKPEKIRLL